MKTLFCALSLVVAVSCANSTPAPQTNEATTGPTTTTRLLSPVKVTWEELSRTETEAVAVAKIERVLKLDLPFLVKVQPPEGVTVKEGRTILELLPNKEAVVVTERFVFTFDKAPANDALLFVDGNTGAMGFHFEVPYRFGRAAPEDVSPATSGAPVQVGGKTFGPGVPLK